METMQRKRRRKRHGQHRPFPAKRRALGSWQKNDAGSLARSLGLTRPVVQLFQPLPHRLIAQDVKPGKLDSLFPQEPNGLPAETTLGRRGVALHEQDNLVLVHECAATLVELFVGLVGGGHGRRWLGGWGGGGGRGGLGVLFEQRQQQLSVGTRVASEQCVALGAEAKSQERTQSMTTSGGAFIQPPSNSPGG